MAADTTSEGDRNLTEESMKGETDSSDGRQGGEDLTGDGGIIRSILCEGQGHHSPVDDSLATVYLKGTYQDVTFDEREVTFTIALGLEYKIIDGIQIALTRFRKGERSLLTISHSYAFGESGCEELGVPGCTCVQYEVELINFMKPKKIWQLTSAEKVKLAERYKSKGTVLYKANAVAKAYEAYSKAKSALQDDSKYTEQERAERGTLLLQANLNCALCQLKLSQWNGALESCNSVLDIESQNEKALFRKAQAYMGREDYSEAINAFQQVVSVNPSNKTASNSITIAKHKLKNVNKKVKGTYAGMFQRFADKDNQEEALAKAKGAINNEPIGYWSNDMAAGMMSLQQEMEAFGERMPERSRRSPDGSGGGSPRQ